MDSGKVNFVKNTFILTGVMMGVWAFLSGISTGLLGEIAPESQELSNTLLFFGIVLANILVLEWYILRTTVKGRKLFLVLFLEIFGVMFFMPQIETYIFNAAVGMPVVLIVALTLTGIPVAVVVSRLAINRFKKKDTGSLDGFISSLWNGSSSELAWKFIALGLLYMVLYVLFGYFVAWQFVELRVYYSGSTEILGFFEQLLYTLRNTPVALPAQFFRGLIWAGLAFLATRTMDSEKTWEKPVIVGLLMSVGLCLQILLPQVYMPFGVRIGHFPELLFENFLFGMIATKIFE